MKLEEEKMLTGYFVTLTSIAVDAKVLNQTSLFNEVIDLYNMALNYFGKNRTTPRDKAWIESWSGSLTGEGLENTHDFQWKMRYALKQTPRDLEISLENSLKLFKNDPAYRTITYAILENNGKI